MLNLELESFEKYYLNIKSPITVKQYIKYIKQFFKAVPKLPEDITKKDVRSYISDYLSSGRDVVNITVSLPALKLYFTFLNNEAGEDYLDIKIFEKHDYPSRSFKEQRFTSYNDVRKILKVLNKIENKFIRVRAKTAILIFATTGARKREVALLQLKDVKINEAKILFIKTKNKKPRYVNIPPITVKAIKKYLELRNSRPMKNSNYFLISGSKSNSKSHEGLMINLFFLIRKDIPNFSFHAIRRGYATELLNNNVPLIDISTTLGHQTIDITVKNYLTLNNKRLDNSRSSHPAFRENNKKQGSENIVRFDDIVRNVKGLQ